MQIMISNKPFSENYDKNDKAYLIIKDFIKDEKANFTDLKFFAIAI